MSLRWMCIKSFMNSQRTSYQEQLSGAIMKKEDAFSTYKISKYIFSPRRSEVYIFLVSGNILFQFPTSKCNFLFLVVVNLVMYAIYKYCGL